ncbi:chemotaxis protein CheW [bacterium]|nr:chemotaxis protein CheW [bacterium]MBU1989894.1 chemotaxis protein CheW [bacterium]
MDELYEEGLYAEEEEIDLLKLVSTNANEASQFLLFHGSNGELYAKNVSKIEELVVYKDIDILYSNDNGAVIGTGDIRGEMTTLVNFDAWIGNERLDENEYELVIVAAYGGYRLGIVVKGVENIVTIESEDMRDNSSANSKSSFAARIKLYGKEQLCSIFDSDKLLLDIFEDVKEQSDAQTQNVKYDIDTNRVVFFADDSKYIRVMVSRLCEKMSLRYELFENGKELVDAIVKKDVKDIALVITDIEMPAMSGREVIKRIREMEKFDDINIIVHTNMANDIIKEEFLRLGASKVIGKVNMQELSEAINEYIR